MAIGNDLHDEIIILLHKDKKNITVLKIFKDVLQFII